jgi:catechol 2,3-dioxygenase-like lactoylglutathione lyase family enzyme
MGAGYVDALVKSNKIMAATLFTEDLERSKEFCAGVFGLPVHWEDADSAVFMFGDAMVNLTLINGPMDRPWGIRTACFADPSGHIWEIAAELPKS